MAVSASVDSNDTRERNDAIKRLYWSCTHTTLRKTEIPLLLEAGFEAIPEEVNTGVLNIHEASTYDDVHVHPVIEKWMSRCSLDTEYLNITRRCRLQQRDGILTPYEIEIFNCFFDVIYIATNLDAAVNTAKWFTGTVVFRYFGFWDNLKSLRNEVSKYPRNILKKIVFCPIFESLRQLPESSAFKESLTVHGFIEKKDTPETWRGFRPGQNAVLVAHNIKNASDTLKVISEIKEEHPSFPIRILGKNNLEDVPQVIRDTFDVTGFLHSDQFFKGIADSRFLIHPFGSPYHNHYSNLEACVSEVPVLFLRANPLLNENRLIFGDIQDPAQFGAFDDIRQLIKASESVFTDKPQLEAYSNQQRKLLRPFSRGFVLKELSNLYDSLPITRSEQFIQKMETPYSQTACQQLLLERKSFFQEIKNLSIIAFLNNNLLNSLKLTREKHQELSLRNTDVPTQIIIGDSSENFSANHEHHLSINASALGKGSVSVHMEVFCGKNIVATSQVHGKIGILEEKELTIEFSVFSRRKFVIALYFGITGRTELKIEGISHFTENPDPIPEKTEAKGRLITRSRITRIPCLSKYLKF